MSLAGEQVLEPLQRDCFDYFVAQASPVNGLIPDSTSKDSNASIATTGFGLAAYAVGVSRGYMTRAAAVECTLKTLRFFADSVQGEAPDATGHKGFYYHFLDMQTGRRVVPCELSVIDSSLLIAGMLTAATFFDADVSGEREIRALADALYRRADWIWALAGRKTVAMGWKPECGFLNYSWDGYSEAIIVYVLGLGSPTYPLPEACYQARTATYQWENLYGFEYLHAGPLFIHQFSHLWIDFRGIQDAFMRGMDSDYFENSRRAVYVQREYAMRNTCGFRGYHEKCFGLSAGDGPGGHTHRVDGVEHRFSGYAARGVPYGPDDGTLAPWAVVGALPFAPEIVLPVVEHLREAFPGAGLEIFKSSFNPSFLDETPRGWVPDVFYGLELGPIVLMVENYRSEFLWSLMRRCPYLVSGLRQAGFEGGWL